MSIYQDEQRYPTLSESGASMLQFLSEHPHAPIYRNQSGNKLTKPDIEALNRYEKDLRLRTVDWNENQKPTWLKEFVEDVYSNVPHYRLQGTPPKFQDIHTITRADLSHDITAFVPDTTNAKRMIAFSTTGTSGNPLTIPSHPRVAAMYLCFHRRALRRLGIELTQGPSHVGAVLVGFQERSFTYISVTPQLAESGLAKINLTKSDWHNSEDRGKYLDALNPEIYTGDPLSLSELMQVPLQTKPSAIISVGMMLSAGLKKQFETHFQAPVLDIYSMNEAGPIGVYDSTLKGHLLLQPDLFVEIVDAHGNSVPPGERGEVTLTGGFNFCLPLLRYRTGDFAAISYTAEGPMLTGLAGRQAVRYKTATQQWLNNIEITHALQHLPLAQFSLHQAADGALTLKLAPVSMSHAKACSEALENLFGLQSIKVVVINAEDKILQYTSDLLDAHIEYDMPVAIK